MRKPALLLLALLLLLPILYLPGVRLWYSPIQKTTRDHLTGLAAKEQSPIPVYYAGPAESSERSSVLAAIRIYPGFNLVSEPAQAHVLVINGRLTDGAAVRAQVQRGAGLVLVLGPDTSSLELSALLGVPVQTERRDAPLSLVQVQGSDISGVSDPLFRQIVWNSAPQIRQRATLDSAIPGWTPLVVGFEQPEIILASARIGNGQVFLLTPFLDGANPQFQEWAYFNYLFYHLAARSASEQPLSFADYPASPVPHAAERAVLFALLGGLLLLAVLAFLVIRRYSRAHPEDLDRLVADRGQYAVHQAGTDWEAVGFHRPLGGFLLALMLGLVLFIPLIVYQNLVLPVFILPSAQALGIWGRVTQFFNFLWLFLDMGTSIAFIKFFAQYRVHDPRKAIQYGQIFVWWQVLSGAVQVALITALAGTLLPETPYALYAWSIILHAAIQVPGFYQLYRHALMGWQRFDFAQVLDLGLAVFFPILAQPVIVGLLVAWGRSRPIFGPAMGGLLGLGLAAYATELLTFLLGLLLYRRLGYNASLLFLAHFDWDTIKSSFRFGVFEMFGSVAWAVGQAAEIIITQGRLINYTEVWGNWVVAQNFVYGFNVVQTLFMNLMPAISESISHARQALSQYYSAMAYKWGGMISAFIGAVLLAVADRFILGATGPEFVRAAAYTVPLVLWGAVQYPSWVGDTVQLGSNRPYLKMLLVAGEQVIRILLALVLLKRFQINALIIAYFAGLLAKDLVAFWINDRLCYPQLFYFWQSLGAPLLAGAAHWALLRWFTGLVWNGDQVTSILIFLIGILFSYPLFAFLYGLAGGWDDATLDELHHATALSGFTHTMARLFWTATTLGTRFSPLHNRFPIGIRPLAMQEAASLTEERVDI